MTNEVVRGTAVTTPPDSPSGGSDLLLDSLPVIHKLQVIVFPGPCFHIVSVTLAYDVGA